MIESEKEKQYESVSGKKKATEIYNNQINIIEQFLNKCNEKDIQGAYDLLSDECKTVLYPSIKNFIDGYYNRNFEEKKSYSYQVWTGDTYKIELRPDVLSTGMYSDSAYTEDYYTLSEGKLNISSYIGKKKVNKEVQKYNIKIKIVDIDFYRGYSICNIRILNETEEEILLDSREEEQSIFFIDKNNIKINSYISELDERQLRVLSGENKEISIKFNYLYREKFTIDKVSFNNIIMNYRKYELNEIEEEEIKSIEIDV